MYRGQIVFTALVLLAVSVEAPTFRDTQAAFPRVRVATARTAHTLDSLYRQVEVTADSLRLLLRVLKSERMVEVWAGGPGRAMRLMKEYPFTGFSGELGPKRARGDR